MNRIGYVDAIGGAAGDMLLAALIDAGASLEAVRRSVRSTLGDRVSIEVEEVRRAGLRALHLRPRWQGSRGETAGRSIDDLRGVLERSTLPGPVRAGASSVLDLLAGAEQRAHGTRGGRLELDELGADDTLMDVVGVAAALGSLRVGRLLVSPLPMPAGGSIESGHGPLPLPAPAVLELLRGFRVRPGGPNETVTPTGAAILSAFGAPTDSFPAMRLEAVGYGAGGRDPEGHANVVRLVLGEPSASERRPQDRDLRVLEANIDDLSPQLVADAAESMLAAGALDAWITPVQMKKGRPGLVVSALCEEEREMELRDVFYRTTTTLGVRSTAVRRSELERRMEAVDLPDGRVRVKLGLLGERVITATPEHDDAVAVAARAGRDVRAVLEEAQAAALAFRLAPATGEDGP